ncbi:MAG: PHP domain-containing protein [Nitrospinae bacterium]|nr:PHP domain-containing protein [Nitrospinota bacterium]
MNKKFYDYAGAVHFHSNYSYDGNVSIDRIVEDAKSAGLDFIMLTDHFRLDAKRDGHEGWHGDVLLIVGEEISPRYNHLLAFGIREPIVTKRYEDKPQEYIDEVNNQGGFGIIAHPDHEGTELFGVKPFPWIDWSAKGYTGMSIWNLQTDWQDKLKGYPSAIFSYFFTSYCLSGAREVTLKRWDELNMARQAHHERVTGIGEIDNHNAKRKFFGLNFYIFNFIYAFKTIRTHILTEKPFNRNPLTHPSPSRGEGEGGGEDIETVYQAIKEGRVYVAQEYWNSAKGFSFSIGDGESEAGIGGEFLLKDKPAFIKVNIPAKGLIRIICNGEKIYETPATGCSLDIKEKGIYRVEVYQKIFRKYRPWIYSNHINVK